MKTFTDEEIKNLEKLGWGFYPTGPNEWEWLKFKNETVIAQCGDRTWAQDVTAVSS